MSSGLCLTTLTLYGISPKPKRECRVLNLATNVRSNDILRLIALTLYLRYLICSSKTNIAPQGSLVALFNTFEENELSSSKYTNREYTRSRWWIREKKNIELLLCYLDLLRYTRLSELSPTRRHGKVLRSVTRRRYSIALSRPHTALRAI